MKAFIAALLLFSLGLSAETAFSGEGEALGRISLSSSPEFLFRKLKLGFSISGDLNENAAFAVSPVLYMNFSDEIGEMSDISKKGIFPETRLLLGEAYVHLKRFPASFVDLGIGRQKVTMGKGDVVSPVDVICPDDLSDPLKFDEKIAKELISACFYAGGAELALYYSPVFTPSLLFEDFIDLKEQFKGVDYIRDTVVMPAGITESSDIFAVLSGDISSVSLSAFYGYTRTHTPLPLSVTVEMASMTSALADIEFFFPRMHTAGVSISGSAGDVGVWADFSANYISQTEYSIDLSSVGRGVLDTFSMEKKYFFNGLAGMDYTFEGGFYVSLQYAHGMRGEYGEETMHDYVFMGTRLPLMNERILLEPLNFSYEINDFKMITKRGAIVAYPKATYKGMDNLEISAALIYVNATSETNFNRMDGYDGVELSMKYYF